MNTRTCLTAHACAVLLLLPLVARGAENADATGIGQKLLASMVVVEYALQFDKGEAPYAAVRGVAGPADMSQFIAEQRPMEQGGCLVGPRLVVTNDPQVHERFIKSIAVRLGRQTVPARVIAWARDQDAIFLELEQPLAEASPLKFDPTAAGPYFAATREIVDGQWMVQVRPMETAVLTGRDRRLIAVTPTSLFVDRRGTAVGLSMNEHIPAEGWKGSPEDWPRVPLSDLRKQWDRLLEDTAVSLPRVTLYFRSPQAGEGKEDHFEEPGEMATVQEVQGLLVEGRKLLVLAHLRPRQTARLERIRMNLPDGKTVAATFVASLREYGCFVAKLDGPVEHGGLRVSPASAPQLRDRLLSLIEVRIQGEQRTAHADRCRIAGFVQGWKGRLYPQVAGDLPNSYVFDSEGRLVSLHVARRRKFASDEFLGSPETTATLAADLFEAIAALPASADPHNVPLTEDQENRLAWLGVELQAMTPELARANKVAHLCGDGRTGALITYVYANSPAARAGIAPGQILLRLMMADEPQPVEVQITPHGFADRAFPWERLEEVPEQIYERIPRPWPPVENQLTRTLTDLGFGTRFTAEFFDNGRVFHREFVVEQSPPHFDAAPKFKAEGLGLTVRDLTYEVRRYFQRADDEPGVVISRIEPGSRASVAGLKPFEVITHVNDQPVPDVKGFQKLLGAGGDVRLGVRRMSKGRIVRIQMP